jgi:hypothetical protein
MSNVIERIERGDEQISHGDMRELLRLAKLGQAAEKWKRLKEKECISMAEKRRVSLSADAMLMSVIDPLWGKAK